MVFLLSFGKIIQTLKIKSLRSLDRGWVMKLSFGIACHFEIQQYVCSRSRLEEDGLS